MNRRKDHTALTCLGIVAIAAMFNVGRMTPEPIVPDDQVPRIAGWADPIWDWTCNMTWHLPPWCPEPVPDPPKLAPPDDCDIYGPCPEAMRRGVVVDDGVPFRR